MKIDVLKNVSMKDLRERIEKAVLDVAVANAPGSEKFDKVVEEVSAWVDERVKWKWAGPLEPVLEAADGPAIKKMLVIPIQMVYEELKNAGRL